MRKLTILLLALALATSAATAKKNKKSGKEEISVLRYLLMTEGAVRTTATEAEKDGEPIWNSVNTTTILPKESIEYIPVTPRRTVRKIELPGGEVRESDITRFQWTKDVISCRFAYALGDDEKVLDECKFIELEGPVELDHTWEFHSTRLEPEPALASGLAFDYRSRVGRAEMGLSFGESSYTGCLTITTSGRTTTTEGDTCADGTTVSAGTVESTSTRWYCPGVGPLKEVTSVRLKTADKLCTEYRYVEMLQSIEVP